MDVIKSLFAVAALLLHGCAQVNSEQTDAPAATQSDSVFIAKYTLVPTLPRGNA